MSARLDPTLAPVLDVIYARLERSRRPEQAPAAVTRRNPLDVCCECGAPSTGTTYVFGREAGVCDEHSDQQ